MKKEVLEFTCDNCGAQGDPLDVTKHPDIVKRVPFPIGWVGILRIGNNGPSGKMLLCRDCDKVVDDALRRRRKRSKHIV